MGAFRFGIHGLIDRAINKTTEGAFKGIGGFVTGMGRGISKTPSNAFNKSGIGKVTSAIGHGVGTGVANATILGSTGIVTGASKVANWKSVSNSAIKTLGHVKDLSYKAYMAGTRDVTQEMIDKGYTGLGGRIINTPTAYALGAGAVGIGVMDGMGKADYNFGLKYTVNGVMDTQGVSITPGSVNASYTPIHNKQGNGLRDLGTDQIGFSLHNQRRTGQIH